MAKPAPRSLSRKVVAITGAARGIGLATAKALTREGAVVAIGDLDAQEAQDAAKAVGGGAIGLQLDVTDRHGFTGFLDQVEERLGSIDVLVNNAGIMPIGPFHEETEATTIRQLEVNLHGVIHGTREAVKRMRPRGTGHIVNVASMAGRGGFPGGATYCATKFGVYGLSEAVKAELRGTGVEISCVQPAIVDTELAAGTVDTKGVKKSTPEDVADAIVAALKAPRFDVIVPKSAGTALYVMTLLPRGLREGMGRLIGADKALAGADSGRRKAYEQRVARSAPAAEHLVEEAEAPKQPV